MAVKYLNCRAWEVQAMLAGTRTQMRRVMKPQPFIDRMGNFCAPDRKGKLWNWGQHVDGTPCTRNFTRERVPYAPGDLLYVKETWAQHHPSGVQEGRFSIEGRAGIPGPPPVTYRVIYRADGDPIRVWHCDGYPYRTTAGPRDEIAAKHPDVCSEMPGWTPSVHMPRELSRLTLKVTDVRVQRVRDISAEDAIAEGIDRWMTVGEAREAGGLAWGGIPERAPDDAVFWIADYDPKLAEEADRAITLDPREAYLALWDSIHGEGAWDRNDWVAAYSFTVHQANVDDLLRERGEP